MRAAHILRGVRRLGAIAGPCAVLALASALLRWASADAVAQVRRPGPVPFDALLTVGAAATAWCIVTWLALTLLLAVVAQLTERTGRVARLALRLSPRGVRRCAALLLGLSLLPAATPAYADRLPAVELHVASTGVTAASPAFDRPADPRAGKLPDDELPGTGWTADRPARTASYAASAGGALRLATSPPSEARAPAFRDLGEVVVVRGDTLWALVSDYLGPAASASDVAREWPRWYEANRHTIGPDPDLIRPGQRLSPPRISRADPAGIAQSSTPSTEEIP